MCIYIYIYTHTYTYTLAYTYIYIYTRIHTYIMCIYIYIYIHTNICTYIYIYMHMYRVAEFDFHTGRRVADSDPPDRPSAPHLPDVVKHSRLCQRERERARESERERGRERERAATVAKTGRKCAYLPYTKQQLLHEMMCLSSGLPASGRVSEGTRAGTLVAVEITNGKR